MINDMDNKELAGYFDGTILTPTASPEEIKRLCKDAVALGFKSVCVNPVNLPLAGILLKGSEILMCTVVGFPLGEISTAAKVREACESVSFGACEIDMVASASRLKSGDYNYYLKEIEAVKTAIRGLTLKVIIETCYLNADEIKTAASLCVKGGADIVKTSTGFGTRGVSIEDIRLIKSAVQETKDTCGIKRYVGIKASGGIKTREFALELIEAGATRLGVSKYNDILF